jgi:hypothetical protein
VRTSSPWSAALLPAALLVSACAGNKAGGEAAACSQMDPNISAVTNVADLAGEYELTLVATSGPENTHQVSGNLQLHPSDSADRVFTRPDGSVEPNVAMPLYGATGVSLAPVGAVTMGDLSSLDPQRPGVAVLEQRESPGAAPGITLRLGAQANQRGMVRFDGGYTALDVTWVAPGGFGGSWRSGVSEQVAAGYFCALKRR